MSLAVSLMSLTMSPVSLPRLEASKLRREAHEAVHGEDMWLRWLEIQGYDRCEGFLGRFKRAPVAPTNLSRQRKVGRAGERRK